MSTLIDRLRVVNVGLEVFAEELAATGVSVIHVDWRPPNPRVAALLARLDDQPDDRGASSRRAPGSPATGERGGSGGRVGAPRPDQ